MLAGQHRDRIARASSTAGKQRRPAASYKKSASSACCGKHHDTTFVCVNARTSVNPRQNGSSYVDEFVFFREGTGEELLLFRRVFVFVQMLTVDRPGWLR